MGYMAFLDVLKVSVRFLFYRLSFYFCLFRCWDAIMHLNVFSFVIVDSVGAASP
jgi:hypothetical protein